MHKKIITIRCKCGAIKDIPKDKIIKAVCKNCGESFLNIILVKKQKELFPYLEDAPEVEDLPKEQEKEKIPIDLMLRYIYDTDRKTTIREIETLQYKLGRSVTWEDLDKVLDFIAMAMVDEKEEIWVMDGWRISCLGIYKNMKYLDSIKQFFEISTNYGEMDITIDQLTHFKYLAVGYSMLDTEIIEKLLEIVVKGLSKTMKSRIYHINLRSENNLFDNGYLDISTKGILKEIPYYITIMLASLSSKVLQDELEIPVNELIDYYNKKLNKYKDEIENDGLNLKSITFKQIKKYFNIVKEGTTTDPLQNEYFSILEGLFAYKMFRIGYIFNKIIQNTDIEITEKQALYILDEIPLQYIPALFKAFYNYTYKEILAKEPYLEYYYIIKNIIQHYYNFDINKFEVKITNKTTFNNLIVNIIAANPILLADSTISREIFTKDISLAGKPYEDVIALIFFIYNAKLNMEEAIITLEYLSLFDYYKISVIKFKEKKYDIIMDILKPVKIIIGSNESHQYNIIQNYNITNRMTTDVMIGKKDIERISVLTDSEIGEKIMNILSNTEELRGITWRQKGYEFFRRELKHNKKIKSMYDTKVFNKIASLFSSSQKKRILIKYIENIPFLIFIYEKIYIFISGNPS